MLQRSIFRAGLVGTVLPLIVASIVAACAGNEGTGSASAMDAAGAADDDQSSAGAQGDATLGESSGGSSSSRCTPNDTETSVVAPTDAYKAIGNLQTDATNLYFQADHQLYSTPLADGGPTLKLASAVDTFWLRDTDVLIRSSDQLSTVSKNGGTPHMLPGLTGWPDRLKLAGDQLVELKLTGTLYTLTAHGIDTGDDEPLTTFQSSEWPAFIVVGETVFVTTSQGTDFIGDPETPTRRASLQAVSLQGGNLAQIPVSPPMRNLIILGASGEHLIFLGEPKNSGVAEDARKLTIFALPKAGGTLQTLATTDEYPIGIAGVAWASATDGMIVARSSVASEYFWIPAAATPTAMPFSWCWGMAIPNGALALGKDSLYAAAWLGQQMAVSRVELPKTK